MSPLGNEPMATEDNGTESTMTTSTKLTNVTNYKRRHSATDEIDDEKNVKNKGVNLSRASKENEGSPTKNKKTYKPRYKIHKYKNEDKFKVNTVLFKLAKE